MQCNVANANDLETAVEAAEEYGGIDIMVNGASIVVDGGWMRV